MLALLKSNFKGANLSGATLVKTEIEESNLRGKILDNAVMT